MRFLFVLTELPYPSHRNGVTLINYEIISRAPADAKIDLLIADTENEVAEKALRAIAPQLGEITYVGLCGDRRYRIGNLISGAISGRCIFESAIAVHYLRRHVHKFDAIYVAPLMTYIDVGRFENAFLNAVDSFSRLNANSYKSTGRKIDLIKSQLYRCYEKKVLARVALTSFVSRADMEYVRAQRRELPLVCTPNGVDADYFRPRAQKPEPFSLIFTGNFSYGPNKEAALYFVRNVLPLLIARHPKTHLYLVGRNPPSELVGSSGVTVTGFVEDIREFYVRCSVFVCPLLGGAGIKNKVLEAMACGVPVVTTRLGADGIDGINAGEHYMSAETPAEFFRCLNEIWENPEKAERMVEAARGVIVNRMKWSQIVANYYQHLATVSKYAVQVRR
ncbi:glycosyltransferase family 4 protein [Pandoraea sp.]|uniref:glycosyltransferase family 4 protein n=1 Tax=Pandoraea sp. TaxID=1883445 RepID=UPI0011F45054|nr:glycosyltransferase family 4 protein [Pandoraea sp.]TAL55377.1 MAG: glycosyltransferase [Pandoraea sp.]TAM15705.1 MAG: glycosyltransferase [Pandoraea sp.]